VASAPGSIAADIDPIDQHNAARQGEEVQRSFIFQPQSLEQGTNLFAEAITAWSPLKRRIYFHLSEMHVAAQIRATSKDTKKPFNERVGEMVRLKNFLYNIRTFKQQLGIN
jgi:hypothetical protein